MGDMDRRNFFQLMTAAAAGGLVGCASTPETADAEVDQQLDQPSPEPDCWPEIQEGQLEVIPFATSHLAYGGPEDDDSGHLFYLDAGDVLSDERQRELEELAELISSREPDRVAVEFPAEQQQQLQQVYEAYRAGEDLPPMDLPFDFERSEIVQVAFRVADRLDHDRVLAVDHPQSMQALIPEDQREELVPFEKALDQLVDKELLPHPVEDIERLQQGLDEGSLVEHFRELNEWDGFAANSDRMFYAYAFEYGDVGEYLPGQLMVAYFQRNMRILTNLWNMVDEDDERVFLLFGASHLPHFRHILEVAPMYAPVNPMSVFDG